MRSYLSWEEAQERRFPKWAWNENREADERADRAAEEHAIPAARLSCFEWARTVGQLVRQRITHANMDAIERRPPMTWEGRDGLRKKAKKQKPAELTLDQLAEQSKHRLEMTTTGWKRLACTQTAVSRRETMARWWLQ